MRSSTPNTSRTLKEDMHRSRPEYTAALSGILLICATALTVGPARGRTRSASSQRLPLLDPYARQVLGEINTYLLRDTGQVTATGVCRSGDGGLDAIGRCHGQSSRPPHLAGRHPRLLRRRSSSPASAGGTAGDWPLNVFDEKEAAAELPTMRAAASAELQNLVLQLGGDIPHHPGRS